MAPDMDRRGFLCGVALLSVGSLVSMQEAVAATGFKVLSNGKVEVDLASNPALSKVGGVVRIDGVNSGAIAVIRTSKSAKGYSAIDLACTHQGFTVERMGSGWTCPEHGARYSVTGKKVSGLANGPLKNLPVSVKGKKLTVG